MPTKIAGCSLLFALTCIGACNGVLEVSDEPLRGGTGGSDPSGETAGSGGSDSAGAGASPTELPSVGGSGGDSGLDAVGGASGDVGNRVAGGSGGVGGASSETCDNGLLDGDETDLDCGGDSCAPCGMDRRCSEVSDCASGICSNERCVAHDCFDGILDADETDVDCGGDVCAPCATGARCASASDCESYVCGGGTCLADLSIPATDLIDDMEDANLAIRSEEGRYGTWYGFHDGTGTLSYAMSTIPGGRGAASVIGLHARARGFSSWGSGVGLDLSAQSSLTKEPYDASAYKGVTFWARAEKTTTLSVVFTDKNTDSAGGICTRCDHHWLTNVVIGAEWRRHTIEFDSLVLESGGEPVPEAPDISGLIAVHFRASGNVDYDLWIDDIAFLR